MTTALTTYGTPGSASLVRREDLFAYGLRVSWAGEHRDWRGTDILLPSGRSVALPSYVAENAYRPRMFHPEYALAVELMIYNAVVEAEARGFEIVAAELGLWPYKTVTQLGKRVTRIGLPEPIVREDGRTLTRKAYQWVSPEGKGILLLPWPNGDQVIRFKDERGVYISAADETTAAATKCRQVFSWKDVHSYPALPYETARPWEQVPLLEAGDTMVELVDCEGFCKTLYAVNADLWVQDATWDFVDSRFLLGDPRHTRTFKGTGLRWCAACYGVLMDARMQAAAQGWDYDRKLPLQAPRNFPKLVDPTRCEHRWGQQLHGQPNEFNADGSIQHNLTVSFECIVCGMQTPDEHLTNTQREVKLAQEMRSYRKRKRN